MAIQESDPARRNLYVVSLAFIVYALAGGSFEKDEIRLQVINMHFSNPHVLGLFAWIALFWFLFRYWQSREYSLGEIFKQDVECIKKGFSKFILTKIVAICKKEKISSTDNHAVSVLFNPLKIQHGLKGEDQCLHPLAPINRDCIISNKVGGFFIKCFLFVDRTISKPHIVSHISPYALFIFALYLNISSLAEILSKVLHV